MPPKKQTQLSIPKTRRHTKQLHKAKSIPDETIVRIGGSQPGESIPIDNKRKKHFEIHQEGLDDIDKMLRAFDLNYAYGPCVGINRMDRWERAKNLGLYPPEDIKNILMKDKSNKYSESIFHQFRMI